MTKTHQVNHRSVQRSKACCNAYHQNGEVAYHEALGNAFHDNGEVAYDPKSGNAYYDGGQLAYSRVLAKAYHANGRVAYSQMLRKFYDCEGTALKKSALNIPLGKGIVLKLGGEPQLTVYGRAIFLLPA